MKIAIDIIEENASFQIGVFCTPSLFNVIASKQAFIYK